MYHFFVYIISSTFTVQCQTSVEREVRANLTKLVKFVVGEAAEPNTDLINLAFASGGSPKTQEERIAYLNIMKQIARATPEVVKNFTTTVTQADGTKLETIDETALDAQITIRAMQYVQKDKETSNPAPAPAAASTSAPAPSTAAPTNAPQPYPADSGISVANDPGQTRTSFNSAIDSFQNNLQGQLSGIRDVVQNQVKQSQVMTSNDGSVSLLDLFNMNRALTSMENTQRFNNEMGFF